MSLVYREIVEQSPRRMFTVSHCLGRGGFGEVYAASMTSAQGLQTEVALKVLRADLAMSDVAVQRLRDEGKLLARVRHPAIVVVHDLLELDGRVALVTEYVRGQDLGECLDDPDPPSLRAMLEICGQVAGALHAAWSTRVSATGEALRLVHRDVKPSNVRVGRHGEVKLLDFGIARSDEVSREARTGTDMLIGSPGYMAPERFIDGQVRSASDVYAVGVMLAEHLIRARLFGLPIPVQAGMAVVRARHDAHIAERLADLDVPHGVRVLLQATLAHDPEARPSAFELAQRSEELADEAGGISLGQWCRDRAWPDPEVFVGPLDGRTLTEGTQLVRNPTPQAIDDHAPVDGVSEISRTPIPAPSRRDGWLLGGLSALGVLVMFLGMVAVGGVGLWAWSTGQGALPGSTDPVPAVTAPEPEVRVPPARQPDPEPAPDPAGPVVRKPKPPVPTMPPPALAPEVRQVAAPLVPKVPVRVAGEVVASVVVDGVRVVLPAEVQVGRWPVEARFNGRDWRPTEAVVDAVVGAQPVVRCGADMERCLVE